MKKLIGNVINVFLKSSEEIDPIVSGILLDVDSDTIYVHSAVNENLFAVPISNISHCTSDNMPKGERKIVDDHIQQPSIIKNDSKEDTINNLDIFINNNIITSIPVPPTFKLDTWNENIVRIFMGNQDVRTALSGRTQKSINYYPGKVYIEVEDVIPPSQLPDGNVSNTFAMGGASTEFLNPSQMVARLNKVASGGKNEPKM